MTRVWVLMIFVLWPVVLDAAQLKVCTTGCGYNNNQLQDALDAATPGDEVLLESGHTYASGTDGFVLGAQCHAAAQWDCIVVRTGVSSTGTVLADTVFPSAGIRMDTSYRSVLATILPSVNNSSAIRTILVGETGATCGAAPCVGDGWTLKWLAIGPKVDYAQGPLVSFGSNRQGKEWNDSCVWPDATPACWDVVLPGGESQDMLVEVPRYLSILQSDIYGDPFVGQHVGVLLATKDARVLNNSMTDLKSRRENQAVLVINGLGPHDIENNLLEATTENFMTNGGDTLLQLQATITGSPTTTVVALGTPLWMHLELTTTAADLTTDIYSGIYVAIQHSGTVYSGLTCTTSAVTTSTATCTLSPALPVTPSAGDLVRWSWTNGGLTFKYNWNRKQLSWMAPAIQTPTGLVATPGTGGSLSAGQHCYEYIEWALISGETDAYSSLSAEVCATTVASGKVTLTWPSESHATHYWVFGNGASGAENQYWNVTAPTTTYVDTGTAGDPHPMGFEGQGWLVKNAFELKGCDGAGPMGPCVIQGNLIDRNWCCSQNATVTLKILNQDGHDVSNTLRNTTFRDNWIRHGNRCLALVTSGVPTTDGTPSNTGEMVDVTVTNNLCTDLTTIYEYPHVGGTLNNSAMLITAGEYPTFVGNRGCTRCTLTHNSFFSNSNWMNGPLWLNNHGTDKQTNFILRDNIMARECTDPGCVGTAFAKLSAYINDTNQGTPTLSWNAITAGSSFADHNAWPDGALGSYPILTFPGSVFIADVTLKSTHLSNYTNCNGDVDISGCAVLSSSSLYHAASDGTNIGADIAAIKAYTDIALSGTFGEDVTPPPTSGGSRTRLRFRGSGTK